MTTETATPAQSVTPVSTVAPRWLQTIFWLNLIGQTAIILTGGLVRLTGSGLGCPTWPQCTPGSYTPTATQEQAWHKYVEFGNRTMTFVLTILAIATLLGAIAWARKLKKAGSPRPAIVWLALIPLLGTLAQAVIGGIIVLTNLHPIGVSGHFLISMGLVAGSLVLLWRSREPGDQPVVLTVHPLIRKLANGMVWVALVVLVMGTLVTGSGPNSGDQNVEDRLPFDPRMVSWLHADMVLLFIGLQVGMLVALSVTKAPRPARKAGWALLIISLLQGVIGYTQYFLGVPWVEVMFHLLGAAAVWLAVISLYLTTRTRGSRSVAALAL